MAWTPKQNNRQPNAPTPTICVRPEEHDAHEDEIVHGGNHDTPDVNSERREALSDEILNLIEQRMREFAAEDGADNTNPLCGGCVVSLLVALIEGTSFRSGLDAHEYVRFIGGFMQRLHSEQYELIEAINKAVAEQSGPYAGAPIAGSPHSATKH